MSAVSHVATPVRATIRMGDVASTAAGLLASLAPAEPELALIFASPSATLPVLATERRKGLPAACRIVGCSSAGELSGEGYSNGTAVAIGFPARSFRSEVLVLDELSRLPVSRWMTGLRDLVQRFRPDPGRRLFGILLVDGSAQQEEVLVAMLDAALPHVMAMGGPAGDDLDFSQTFVIADQAVLRDVAILCLIETDLEVRDLIFDHFRATDTRMIVTDLILADFHLGDSDTGPQTITFLRGLSGTEIPAIVVTAHRTASLVRNCARHGVRVLEKPIRPEDQREALLRLLGERA